MTYEKNYTHPMTTYKKLNKGKSGNGPDTLYADYVKCGDIALHTHVGDSFNKKALLLNNTTTKTKQKNKVQDLIIFGSLWKNIGKFEIEKNV